MSARERALEARVIQLVGDVGTLTAEKGALEARLRRVEALADGWERNAGTTSDAWRVCGPQSVGVPFAVEAIRAALRGDA